MQHAQQPVQPQGGVNVGYGQSITQGAHGAYPQAYGALPQVMPHTAFQNLMPFQNMPPAAVGGWGAPAPTPATGDPDAPGGVPVSSGGVQQAHFMVNGAGYAPATGMGRMPSDGHVQVNGA